VAEDDFVDVGRAYARVDHCVGGSLYHQAFNGFVVELSEGGVGPSDDAGAHELSPADWVGRV